MSERLWLQPRAALKELLRSFERQEAATHLAEAALEPLLRYDAEHGSDLIQTLKVYFALNTNAAQAANKLFLHRNGLLYRLSRVETLLGYSVNDSANRLALELALHILNQEDD